MDNQPEEPEKVKMKFKVDPIDDVSFGGDYEETDPEDSEEELSSEEESSRKKRPKKKVDKLIMNVSDTKYPVVKFVGKKIFKWALQHEPDGTGWDIFWTDNAVQPEQLGRMQPHQKINHFPGMYSLARKNHLGRNLMKMRKQFPEEYKFFPQTWLLPSEYADFKMQFQRGKTRTFIVKPEASCQGRGIFLTRSIESINPTDHYVVQRYMHKPFLIDGLKFDLRIYVLLAGCEPMRIFVFRDGLVRLATEKYVPPTNQNLEDMCMHLTNYAINKDNPNFVFNQDKDKMDVGHKRGIEVVFEGLREEGHDIDQLWKDIDKIIIKTICSVQPNLSHHYRSCQPDNYPNNMCFEILGFDIFLDNKLKPHLLEVNHTPSFTTDTPLDSHIKKCLIRDTLRLMNINTKTKLDITTQRRELMQVRVLTGKKQKHTLEEKKEFTAKAQAERDEYESIYSGGYRKIYPLSDASDYDKFLAVAQKQYEDWTGANIRRNVKKPPEPVKPPVAVKVARKLPLINKPKIDIPESAKDLQVIAEDEQEERIDRFVRPPMIKHSVPSRNQSRERHHEEQRRFVSQLQSESTAHTTSQAEITKKFQPKSRLKQNALQMNTTPYSRLQATNGNFVMPRMFEINIQPGPLYVQDRKQMMPLNMKR